MPAFVLNPAFFPPLSNPRAKPAKPRKHGVLYRPLRVSASVSQPYRTDPELKRTSEEENVRLFSWTEQWYPVCIESNAPVDQPLAFKIFDAHLVLFSSAPGRWCVLDDRCSHRLAPLSEGRVTTLPGKQDAVLECAYHGWSFEGCGQCACIPQIRKGESGGSIPRRANVRSYPTTVLHGIIWVWFGDEKTADITTIPAPPDASRFTMDEMSACFSRFVPYGYETLLENICDSEHIHYAHHGVSGMFNRSNGGKFNIFGRQTEPNKIVASRRVKGDTTKPIQDTGEFIAPGTMYYSLNIPGRAEIVHWLLISPVTRTTSQVFAILYLRLVKQGLLARTFLNLKPTWLDHFERNNILDGDNVLLRGVQQKAGDPSTWRDKYLPLGDFDGHVLEVKKWMDKTRSSMPWKSEGTEWRTMDMEMNRDKANDRLNSHTIHCNACLGALRGFERAVIVAEWVAKIALIALISILSSTFVGNETILTGERLKNVRLVSTMLSALVLLALAARRSFLWFKAQFISSDEARRRFMT